MIGIRCGLALVRLSPIAGDSVNSIINIELCLLIHITHIHINAHVEVLRIGIALTNSVECVALLLFAAIVAVVRSPRWRMGTIK